MDNTTNGDIYIWQWNARGLKLHIDELKLKIINSVHQPHVICIQETHLTSNTTLPSIQGYSPVYFQHRAESQGGGLAIYINNNIPSCTIIPIASRNIVNSLIEIQSILINTVKIEFQVINVYDPGFETQPKYDLAFRELTKIIQNERTII